VFPEVAAARFQQEVRQPPDTKLSYLSTEAAQFKIHALIPSRGIHAPPNKLLRVTGGSNGEQEYGHSAA